MAVLMLFSHEVKDYETWKATYDANQRARTDAGLVEQFVGRDARKPNVVHIGLMAPSLDAAHQFVSRPELRDAMASAGVTNAPDIRLVIID
jgi:hypothetical protein